MAPPTAQGNAADTKTLAEAHQPFGRFNMGLNTNQNVALQLTEGNTQAGNVLWEYVMDVLGTGALMHKETQPKKAKTFSMASLLKGVRQERGGAVKG